jgi:hypothetical protein
MKIEIVERYKTPIGIFDSEEIAVEASLDHIRQYISDKLSPMKGRLTAMDIRAITLQLISNKDDFNTLQKKIGWL